MKAETLFNLPLRIFGFFTILIACNIAYASEDHDHDHNHDHSPTPLVFIENNGQWHENVLFKSGAPGGAVFLERNGFTYVQINEADFEEQHHLLHEDRVAAYNYQIHGHAWKMKFLGASYSATTNGTEVRPEYYNYFIGNNESKWAGGVKAYKGAHYSSLYDGIGMNVYSVDGDFKYDLIVNPGTSTDIIAMKYEGLDGIKLHEGNLILNTSVGEFKELAPYAYQLVNGEKKEVECHYVLNGNTVRFTFPEGYDESMELVIDPVLVGATLSGTTGTQNYGHCATFDNSGNMYSGAISFGTGYPTTTGAFQTAFGSNIDIGISKLSPDGSALIYATYLGGSEAEYPHSMILSDSEELYIMGTSRSTNYPVSATAFDNSLGSSGFDDDIVVTHLNAAGSALVGSTYIGGSSGDGSNSLSFNYGDTFRGEIVIDAAGNCYVTSCTSSNDFPATGGAYQATFGGGNQDAVVFSLTPDMSTMNWATFLGTGGHEVGFGIRLGNGGIYVSGGTDNAFFTATGAQTAYGGGTADGYLLKLNASGSAITDGTYWGFGNSDYTFFLDLDQDGDVYMYGQSEGGLSPISAGVYANAGSNQYIAKMDPTLSTVLFSTTIGSGGTSGFNDFVPIAFMVDNCEYVYFSGHSSNSALPTTPGALQTTGGFYLGVLEPNAIGLNYATHYGGQGDHVDGGTSRFDPTGTIYQAVCTSNGFNTSAGAWSGTYPSGYDIGIFKIDFQVQGTNAVVNASPSATGCAPFTVNFTNSSVGTHFIWDFDDGSPQDNTYQPSHTFQNAGVYDVMLVAIDSTACNFSDTAYLTITVHDYPVLDLGPDTILCQGTLTLDAGNPGMDYLWSDNSTNQTLTVSTTGTYWVQVDNNGCTVTDSINVNFDGPSIDLGPDVVTCTPQILLDAGNPGATYLWQDNSTNQTFNVTSIGTYWVQVSMLGCSVTDTIEVTEGSISVTLPQDTLLCDGASLTLNAQNPGSNYLWQDNSTNQTLAVTQAGTYWVEVTEGICQAWDTVVVDFYSPVPMFSVADTTGCQPFTTMFTDLSTTPHGTITNWHWDFGDGTTSNDQNPAHEYTVSGNYTVTLTVASSDGCLSSYSRVVEIEVYPQPLAGFFFTPIKPEPGDEISFDDNSTHAVDWLWVFGDGDSSTTQNPYHIYENPGNYAITLHVSTEHGCTDSVQMYLEIKEELIFYIPNAFTPDGDEFNNTFFPVFTSGFDPTDYHLSIYNRWGEIIFESFNHEVGWDGTYGGKLVADNTFTWKIEFGDINDDSRHKVVGHVTILR